MNVRQQGTTGAIGLRVLGALVLLLTALLGTATPTAAQGSVDVAIFTTENGQPAYDACYVLVGYSEVGCDDNGDGRVMFADIPYGSYTVSQVADLGPGRYVNDFTINVVGNRNSAGFESFSATIVNTGGSSAGAGASGYSDVAIVPTENSQPVYDACFVIVDYSEVGCDDNRDGKVTFEDIPLGTWTVRQVADLGPGRIVADFTIQVTGAASGDGWERFPATIASSPGSASSSVPAPSAAAKDISLITRDPDTGGLLTGACYILLDYSNEGCDENGDGQVTFDDMPRGTWAVRQTQASAGYPTVNDFPITVDDSYPNVPVGYLVKQAPQQNSAGTRNVSFVFIDGSTSTKIVPTPICLQIGSVSEVGCDDSLVDGQIDFLDVQTGAHEVAFSNLPAGWQVLGGVGPYTVNIVAGPGPQIIYTQVLTTGGGSASGSGSGNANIPAGSGAIAVVGGGQTGTASSGAPSTGTASTGPAVELILDTSDSMNTRDQGSQTRLEVAKNVTTRLVTETLPAGVPMALRTYSGCSSSLSIPMQPLDPNAATGTISNLGASGKTPIAQSLRAAGNDLDGVSGPKIIVLVTDGEETCGGDPRAAIEALVAQNVDIQVNIVGFAIDDATLTATFQEWARVGNGTYFAASDEIQLDQAVTAASQLSFRVLDQQGSVVANGVVGGGSVAVPPGTYTVEINTAPVTRYENVVVTAQGTTTIDLGTGAVTGDGVGTASTSDASMPSDASSAAQGATAPMDIWAYGPSGHEIGAQFTVTTMDGTYLGSCTLEGFRDESHTVSCRVDVPRGTTVVVTLDEATITPGRAPVENPLYFDTSTNPGAASHWGVGFQIESISGDAGSGSSGEATLLMTFRGCPEGFDPATDDFYANCTIPLDAPGNAFVDFHGEGRGGEFIAMLDRQSNGEYVYTANPGTMNVELRYLDPVVHDTYQVIGADGANGDAYAVYLSDGDTREVFIFYYSS